MQQDAGFVIKTIRSLDQFFEKRIQQKVVKTGVTVPQMRVIEDVVKHQGISIKQLSQNLNMTQSTISGIVERLIIKGYLMKKTNPDDKRFAEIWYTKDIAEFLEKDSTEFVNEAVADVFAQIEPNDLETIIQGLELLLSAVGKASNNKAR